MAFWQGDAHNLKPQFTDFDLVIAANLIDRLYEPRRFLQQIHERICPGGTLLLASPYTWLSEHTERDNWLGGFLHNGEPVHTRDTLLHILDEHFEPLGEPQAVPFVIRETARKFQHTFSEATLWRRKA